MKIAIITPIRGCSGALFRSLASVSRQRITSDNVRVEHIVVDGSGRPAPKRLKKRRGLRWVAKVDRSMYEGLNTGIVEAADASVVGWLNDDDFYYDGILERVAECFESDEVDVLVCDYEVCDRARGAWQRCGVDECVLERTGAGQLDGSWVAPLAVFWRRKALLALGMFDSSLRYVGDMELWLRAADRSRELKVAHARMPAGCFVINEGSSTAGRGRDAFYEEAIRMLDGKARAKGLGVGVRLYARRLAGQTRARRVLWNMDAAGWSSQKTWALAHEMARDPLEVLQETRALLRARAAQGWRLATGFAKESTGDASEYFAREILEDALEALKAMGPQRCEVAKGFECFVAGLKAYGCEVESRGRVFVGTPSLYEEMNSTARNALFLVGGMGEIGDPWDIERWFEGVMPPVARVARWVPRSVRKKVPIGRGMFWAYCERRRNEEEAGRESRHGGSVA